MKKFEKNDAIHCSTKEQALELCKYLDSLGYKWASGDSYLKTTYWERYEDKTCYTPDAGLFGELDSCIKDRMNIIQFFGLSEKNYICPVDLAGGLVKKGTVYKKLTELLYSPEGKHSYFTLPKEIVETWETDIKVGDYIIYKDLIYHVHEIENNGIFNNEHYICEKHDCKVATKEEIKNNKRVFLLYNGNKITVEKGEIMFESCVTPITFLEEILSTAKKQLMKD